MRDQVYTLFVGKHQSLLEVRTSAMIDDRCGEPCVSTKSNKEKSL